MSFAYSSLDFSYPEPVSFACDSTSSVKGSLQSNGDEVAMAIDGVTVGRQIDVEDVIYVELLESTIRQFLKNTELNEDEKMTLQEYLEIKRKSDPFWGM